VWPRGIVVCGPGANELPSLIEIDEQALVEKLVAHPAIEGFDVAILHWLNLLILIHFTLLPTKFRMTSVSATHAGRVDRLKVNWEDRQKNAEIHCGCGRADRSFAPTAARPASAMPMPYICRTEYIGGGEFYLSH
jgi:hypothetical protein